MIFKIFFISILITTSALAVPALEVRHFLIPDINYQVNQYDAKLIKQFGVNGGDMLCWPSTLAHRLVYLKKQKFPQLKLKPDPVENVVKFTNLCRTSLTGGTSQKRKLPCITQAFREAGYDIFTQWLGVDSTTPEVAIKTSDITEPLQKGLAVILHIGWLRLDKQKMNWLEKGSHSVNAYGFQYDEKKLSLQITNPGVDYSSRSAEKMFDMVRVENSNSLKDANYPEAAKLILVGQGFDHPERRAYIKNIFIFGKAN